MIIDSHAHLNDEKFSSCLEETVLKANQNGVSFIVCASYDLPSSEKAVNIAQKFNCVFATVGIHPQDAASFSSEVETKIVSLARQKKVVAWGEIGLDYHYENSQRDVQKKVFERQLFLAHENKLPIIIHMRDATFDTLVILKANKNLLTFGGVMHCFSGSIETAREVLNLGLDISFAGPLTFSNSRESKEVAALVPLSRILVETDSPYLAPVPLRGTQNTPANTVYVAQMLAKVKNISFEEVANATSENAIRLFGLNAYKKGNM